MSTLVTTEFFAQPGRGDDVANLLIEILGESLQHDGGEIIRIVRDQHDPDHVAGVTRARNVTTTTTTKRGGRSAVTASKLSDHGKHFRWGYLGQPAASAPLVPS